MNFNNNVTNYLGCTYNSSLFSVGSPSHGLAYSYSLARRMENEEAIYKSYNKMLISLHSL